MPRDVVVVAGGPAPAAGVMEHVMERLPAGVSVIAADSGLDHALGSGLYADLVVGDMDSVDAGVLAEAEAAGTVAEQYPVAKDETDLQLAMDQALALEPRRITVVSGDGGRLDHLLGTVGLLASSRYAGVEVEAWLGSAFVTVVRDEATLHGEPGDLVTLLPVHGPARGVTTEGLAYPLADEDLEAGTTRGVSNELVGTACTVRLRSGTLLAIQAEAL